VSQLTAIGASLGKPLAKWAPHTFTDTAGLQYAAQTMAEGTVWILILSPPDPNAGVWAGTIGPGGTVIWPSPIDPTPSGGGGAILPDDLNNGLAYINTIFDAGALEALSLPDGEAVS
jgi:hypothetical protein